MFDDLLQRQMLVNKYIATLQAETIQRTEETDKALYKLISDFEMDATKKDKVALAKGGAGSKMAASLLAGIKKTLAEQTEAVAEHVDSQTLELARKEARAAVRLMRPGMSANTQPADKPPSIGVNVSLGVHPRDAVKAMMAKHQNNVIQATASAVNEGTSAVKAIRGTPSLQGKDGVNHKRNNDLNGVVDQVATNTVKKAREEVYIDYKMERVDWVATLDLRACLICARYEMESPYLISKVPAIPHPNCLTGDAEIYSESPILAVTRRLYEGDMLTICTAMGNRITCTPNHPILSDSGFVSAASLNVGSYVISDKLVKRVIPTDMDNQRIPSKASELFDSFRESSGMRSVKVPVSPEHFHGDGFDGDVTIVFADGLLSGEFNASASQQFAQSKFIGGNVVVSSLSTVRPFSQMLDGLLDPAHGIMSSGNLQSSLVVTHKRPLEGFGLTPCASGDVITSENASNDVPGYTEAVSDSLLRFTGSITGNDSAILTLQEPGVSVDVSGFEHTADGVGSYSEIAGSLLDRLTTGSVFLDKIISIDVDCSFKGHVYNLETEKGFYVADGIYNHNCRCITLPHNGNVAPERPFVNDNRSVKYIPKNERAGKIGQTTNNFGQWFDGLNEDYKKQWLGKGRYQLYKEGKINLGDMVKGNPARIVKLTDL